MFKTPKAAFYNPKFYLGAIFLTGHRDYFRCENEKRVSLDILISNLQTVMLIPTQTVVKVFDELPREKAYDVHSLSTFGYYYTANCSHNEISDNNLTVLFDAYSDATAGDIRVRSNKIYCDGFFRDAGWIEPDWLDGAYGIAKKNWVFFQDSQFGKHCYPEKQSRCHFHAGFGQIGSDVEKMLKSINGIIAGDLELTELLN